jgi:excisionase family DNA binding protein
MVPPAQVLLTPAQVAGQIQVHRETVYDLIQAGEFPNATHNGHVGNGRRYRIPQRDVDNFLASRRVAA